jgi:hypothetical protein
MEHPGLEANFDSIFEIIKKCYIPEIKTFLKKEV